MAVDGFNDSISWSGFTRYKARPADADSDAETYTEYRAPTINFGQKGKTVLVKSADVVVSLNTELSWVVEDKMTDELLKHEQGHYDITAIAARQYEKALLNLTAADAKSLQDKINQLDASYRGKISRTNKRYDKQTDHSQIKSAQEKWDKALIAEKKKLDGSLDNLPQ